MAVPDVHLEGREAGRAVRVGLGVLVVAWGAQAIVTQTVLLREATVLMSGSEFAWGVVFFAWLLGVAVGAAVGGWLTRSIVGQRRAAAALVVALLALSVAACAELWALRGARGWLGVEAGEMLPLPKIVWAALLLVSPASALVGMAFPLACCVKPEVSFGRVYALESAGSLIGGAAFSFWAVEHLTPVQTMLVSGGLTTVASAGVMAVVGRVRIGVVSAGLATVAVLTAIFAGDTLNRALVDRRWRGVAPGYERVAEAESRYQNLALGRRAGQYSLYCDGQVAADFPDPYAVVPLTHLWMCEHPSPRIVLLLGGGAEGVLSEVLRHPVEHVDYVEPDPREIELVAPFLAAEDRRALADPRVTVHHVDVRHYVKTQRDRFDLVLARLPEPISALRARLHTDEFYAELRRAMTARAVLCTTAAAAPAELSPMSREYLASIRATLRRHFPAVVIGWGEPAQVFAATAEGSISTEPAELARRYVQRGVHAELFDPAWFSGATDWLDSSKVARRAVELDLAKDAPVCTDLRPLLYIQRLALWEAQSGGRVPEGFVRGGVAETGRSGIIARLRSVSVVQLAGGLTVLGALMLVFCRVRGGARTGWAAGVVTLSVGTTGFATMALSILWLFAFQNLYGYVYQRVGWIIALFMGGLVAGCALAGRRGGNGGRCPPYAWRGLMAVDVLLALLAASVPFVLPVLAGLPSNATTLAVVEVCISAMVVLTGLLGGAAFALAGQLQLGFTGRAGAAAGNVVGADHAGACLGALLCGLVLAPVLGMVAAACLLAGMKLASAALLIGGRRIVTQAN